MRRINSLYETTSNYTDNVKLALMNGCQWVQLRLQTSSLDEDVNVATSIKKLCDEFHAYLIIEDQVQVAKQVKANGVHLTEQANISEARKQLGARYLICVEANDHQAARRYHEMGADCINEEDLGYNVLQMEVSSAK